MTFQIIRCARVILLSILIAGAMAHDLRSQTPDTDIGRSPQQLIGNLATENSCSRFTLAYISRSHEFANTVMNSRAFAQCVRRRMDADYIWCQDPHQGRARNIQVAAAWRALWNSNHSKYSCSYINDSAAATSTYQGHLNNVDNNVDLHWAYHQDFDHWDSLYTPNNNYEPWHWRASDVIHEFMHSHNYAHPPDSMCPAGYSGGYSSVPYLYGRCAADVISTSYGICGTLKGQCPDGEMLLIQEWGSKDAPTRAPCRCTPSARVEAALKNGNNFVSARNGGGDKLIAPEGLMGAWQLFQIVQLNLVGELRSGDNVWLKSDSGGLWKIGGNNELRANGAPTDASHRLQFTIEKIAPASPIIKNGDRIRLKSRWGNRLVYVSNGADRELRLGRTGLSTEGVPAGSQEFTFLRPTRNTLVYLKSTNGRYVKRQAAPNRELVLRSTSPDADSAFWIIDHNGGKLEHNDSVSLEHPDDRHYWSTFSTGRGPMRARANGIGDQAKFQINIVGGSGIIGHGAQVSLRSSDGFYLRAGPDRNLTNNSTAVGQLETFTLEHVSQYDKTRPTWSQSGRAWPTHLIGASIF